MAEQIGDAEPQGVPDTDIDFSRPFKGFDWSNHINVKWLIDSLFAEYSEWHKASGVGKRLRDPDKIRQHLTHFVLEAYRTYRAHPELCMGVHLGNNYYNNGCGRYHPKHLSYRHVKNVSEFLVANAYLELPVGKSSWQANPAPRRTTRFRATPKLVDRCAHYGISRFMIVPYSQPEVIILRGRKRKNRSQGDDIDYEETTYTRQARANVHRINRFIANHMINLDITDQREEALRDRLQGRGDANRDSYIDFTKARLRRIYNNGSFEQGGRFYGGWWQSIPGDYRAFITINGKRTVQLDYSGMHFAIMYADIGMDLPIEDPYALEGYDPSLRSGIKTAFNIIVNCNSRKEAIGAIDGRIRNGELSPDLIGGEHLIEAFARTHPLIQDKIASGEGVRGQYIDSQVAERILLKGIDAGLCILPIHDGFITTAGDGFILEKLMNDAFLEITGHTAHIKPETIDLSLLENTEGYATHWVTRPDGTVERDGPLEGKAISYSGIIPGKALWERLEVKKKNKELREKEWIRVHGSYYRKQIDY